MSKMIELMDQWLETRELIEFANEPVEQVAFDEIIAQKNNSDEFFQKIKAEREQERILKEQTEKENSINHKINWGLLKTLRRYSLKEISVNIHSSKKSYSL